MTASVSSQVTLPDGCGGRDGRQQRWRDFHVRRKDVRKAMRYAYVWVVAEYAQASERLRGGDRLVTFPEGTFQTMVHPTARCR